MISQFTLELPRQVFFGSGIHEKLFSVLQTNAYQRILFLTGRNWFKESGWRNQFETKLKKNKYLFLSCPPGEPEIKGINEILEQISEFQPQVIISIGGGSVIDTGKACAVLATRGKKVEDFLEGIGQPLEITEPGIPHIAMPTTAGTGAEATKNSVIKSEQHQAKKSMRSHLLIPQYVFIDPRFTLQLSKKVTGMAGMDALVQLFEAYVSLKAKPVPRSLIKPAFPILINALKTLAGDPANLEARTDAAYSAFISGIALANSGLGAVHGFASAIGGLTEIPHGLICAMFFIPVLDANKPVILDAFPDLLGNMIKTDKEKLFDTFKTTITELIKNYNLDEEFNNYKINADLIPLIARKATGSSMSGNPRELSLAEREEILKKTLVSHW